MAEPDKPIQVILDVATPSQAAELKAAWKEILSGQRIRLNIAAEDTTEIMERAMIGLQVIVKAVEEHPGTGQSRRLVRFLAGVYNGNDFPFDLTDLRALDTELANACIDYLNYDRLAKAEVHSHLIDGGKQMQWFISQHAILPRVHLSYDDAHEARLYALGDHSGREPYALMKDALENLLSSYETKMFGALAATQESPDGDHPLVHARYLKEDGTTPLCGASDGPWNTRLFDFRRLTCHECRAIVLNPDTSTEA